MYYNITQHATDHTYIMYRLPPSYVYHISCHIPIHRSGLTKLMHTITTMTSCGLIIIMVMHTTVTIVPSQTRSYNIPVHVSCIISTITSNTISYIMAQILYQVKSFIRSRTMQYSLLQTIPYMISQIIPCSRSYIQHDLAPPSYI